MKELYLATYCYGSMKMSTLEMIQTAKRFGFQGLEFLQPLTPEIAAELRQENMRVRDSSATELTPAYAELLKDLGVSYIQGNVPMFGNHEQALHMAELLDQAGKTAAEFGLKVYYHNHTHEWRMDQGEYLMETILNNTDPSRVCMQMDAGWAICAGIDVEAFLEKYSGRVELMHVKACTEKLGPEGVSFMAPKPDGTMPALPKPGADGKPPRLTPEMEAAFVNIRRASGAMKDCIADYKSILSTAEENGCNVFILERDEHYLDNPLDCIREDTEIIRTFW